MNRLWFITGKGGVGKTFVSSKLAERHSDFYRLPDDEISRSVLAEDFLVRALKIKALAHFLGQSKLLQTLMHLAPNLHEILILHEWVKRARQKPLLIDAPSTGHFLGLFRALLTASELFESGLLKEIVSETIASLKEPQFVKVSVIVIPENSALQEAAQIHQELTTQWPSFQRETIANRIHARSEHPDFWSEAWRGLALDRPDIENKRLVQFEKAYGPLASRISEGGKLS